MWRFAEARSKGDLPPLWPWRPGCLPARYLRQACAASLLGGNLFVPRRFSGHSRSVFRGTRGPIANCGFLLEARRKRRGCTYSQSPVSGQRDAKWGHDAFRTSNFRGWQAICGKTRYFLHRPLFSTLHPPSMTEAKLHTMHVKDLPVSRRRCVVERHGSRCSNCASFQSSTVAPCAARVAKQGDNCLACSYIRQASKF